MNRRSTSSAVDTLRDRIKNYEAVANVGYLRVRITTGINAIDSLLPSVRIDPGLPAPRNHVAFLRAVVAVADELSDKKASIYRQRLKIAREAQRSIAHGAKLLVEIDNQPLAKLLASVSREVGKFAAAARLTPKPGGQIDGCLQLTPEVLYPSALNASTTGRSNPKAAAIRTLAGLLDSKTPRINSKLKGLLVSIGIECRNQDVQQALKKKPFDTGE